MCLRLKTVAVAHSETPEVTRQAILMQEATLCPSLAFFTFRSPCVVSFLRSSECEGGPLLARAPQRAKQTGNGTSRVGNRTIPGQAATYRQSATELSLVGTQKAVGSGWRRSETLGPVVSILWSATLSQVTRVACGWWMFQ